MTKVVVMLAGGNFMFAYFGSHAAARAFIAEWTSECNERIESGRTEFSMKLVTAGKDFAALFSCIIGMYIVNEASPVFSERIADALEKMVVQEKP